MATNFVPADAAVLATRTLLYAATTQAVLFSGTVANVDDPTMSDHSVTMEVKRGGSYINVLNKVPVPFGSSLQLPKVALVSGEEIYLTADLVSCLVARLSLVEKT
jgi:hypothetical protein